MAGERQAREDEGAKRNETKRDSSRRGSDVTSDVSAASNYLSRGSHPMINDRDDSPTQTGGIQRPPMGQYVSFFLFFFLVFWVLSAEVGGEEKTIQ